MKDVSVAFVTTGFIQAVNIVTGVLAARLLLPEGRGELAAIILWAGIIAELGNLGLHDALLYRSATRSASPRQLFAAATALITILSVVLIGIGLVVVPMIFENHSAEARIIAVIFLCGYLPTYFTSLFTSGMFQGNLQMTTWNVLRALVPTTYLVAILVLWAIWEAGVAEFAAAYITSQAVAGAVGLYLVARRGWLWLKPELAVMRSLVVYGVKVHVGEVFYSLRQRIDQALISLWLPAADLGIYAVALTVANGPLIMVYTLANVAFPKISQQQTDGGKVTVFGRYLRFSVGVALSLILMLLAVVPWLLPLVFGRAFAPAVAITNILLLGTLPLAIKLMFQQALKAWDRSLVISRAELFGLAVAVIAIFILLPAFGLVGAAWSLVLSQLATASMMGFSLYRELRLPVLKLFVPTMDDWLLSREWFAKVALRLKLRNG
jgi:O-antigen/teichoic acid export membrane protein